MSKDLTDALRRQRIGDHARANRDLRWILIALWAIGAAAVTLGALS